MNASSSSERYVRVVEAFAVRHRGTIALGTSRAHLQFDQDSAPLVALIFERLAIAKTREQVFMDALQACNGLEAELAPPFDEVWTRLIDSGVIAAVRPSKRARDVGRIWLGVTGAAAAMHTPSLVQALQAEGYEVRVGCTRRARAFFSRRAVEALIHSGVTTHLWGRGGSPAQHIACAEWADLVLVAPASATTMSRLARGETSEIVSATALSTRAPVLLAPSMNIVMREAPAIARNIAQLENDGFHILEPGPGIEVADRPGRRALALGAAPTERVIVDCVRAVLAGARNVNWEETYANTALSDLPWFDPAGDADMVRALEEIAQPGSHVLDIGTGVGSLARAAAARGFVVTGLDSSSRALALARSCSSGNVSWVEGNILETSFAPPVRAILDRGCLHGLAVSDHSRYAQAVAKALEPGGVVIIKTVRDSTNAQATPAAGGARPAFQEGLRLRGVTLLSEAALTAIFAPVGLVLARAESCDFGPMRASASSLPGLLTVWRKIP